MIETQAVMESHLDLPIYVRGKVRDVYTAGDALLIVATDRISAFDHVLPTPIPEKGRVLTQLSAFWFAQMANIVRTHVIASAPEAIRSRVPGLREVPPEAVDGRAMLVERCERFEVECVVRGYLTGSAFEEYRRSGSVAGLPLPDGMQNGDRLPEPIFTPATKAAHGHDENITFEQMVKLVGRDQAQSLRTISVMLYRRAALHAQGCGLILADTKFEFGSRDDEIVLIDEALTPDSSRYWDAAVYPDSLVAFDKQFVRDYLNR
ncbi:MAG: phosphoribosylaminoimidazolesuccinocarboxamide synthase, partial [bacterium]